MPNNVPSVDVPEMPVELPDDVTLLDVREQDEWDAGHVPDALHIPMGELMGRLDELPADNAVYVICRSGARSARVTQYLNANGWEATNVDGGMHAWARGNRPMACASGQEPEVL